MNRTTRPIMTAAASVFAALSLAACGGGAEGVGDQPSQTTVTHSSQTTTSSTTTETAAPARTTSPAAPDASAPSSTTASAAPGDESETGTQTPAGSAPSTGDPGEPEIPGANRLGHKTSQAGFVTPSGKIACTYYAMGTNEFARCDLRSGSLPVPQELKDDCEFDMGGSMIVDTKGARPNCVSDVTAVQATAQAQEARWWTPELGATANDEAILPYNYSVGVSMTRCESRPTGVTCRVGDHGFRINDSSYTTW